ncbi:hypothetical protein AKJ09_04647 [Labilithrix luteola]|uniref:Uncharacterized protein n=1 Tax=Labilithrix luteola TaxID=1391654 RepID=A0A0K1PWS8_9BACT|nr:hypothetical protein AKJ09_04647 [Labilithrix luteola]
MSAHRGADPEDDRRLRRPGEQRLCFSVRRAVGTSHRGKAGARMMPGVPSSDLIDRLGLAGSANLRGGHENCENCENCENYETNETCEQHEQRAACD